MNGIRATDEDIQYRTQKFGSNQFPYGEAPSILELIAQCFSDYMLKILLAAAIVSVIIGISEKGVKSGWVEGATIMSTFLCVSFIESFNAYQC